MSDLDGARLKVERAKKHIDDLSLEKAAFLASDPYDITPEYYIEHDMTVYYLDRFTLVPSNISLVVGDAVHLRSALDLLACMLVRRTGKEPNTHTYFPICETAEKYKSQRAGKIKGIGATDIQAIDALKPYGGGNDPLWGLHRLDIADKHRLIATPVVAVHQFGLRSSTEIVERAFRGLIRFNQRDAIPERVAWFPNTSKRVASKAGDPIFSVAGDHEVDQDVELTFDIALGEPEVFKGRPVLETLHQLADLTSGIIASFELS